MVFETTEEAIAQRKEFLFQRKIGVCDIVASAQREKIDASDLGMQDVKLRDLISVLQKNELVDTLLFTGGNSKNGPEYFFRRYLKQHNLALEVVSSTVPRIHKFILPESTRAIKTISLTAPSGAANRAVGSLLEYKKMKAENSEITTIDFRVHQYTPFF